MNGEKENDIIGYSIGSNCVSLVLFFSYGVFVKYFVILISLFFVGCGNSEYALNECIRACDASGKYIESLKYDEDRNVWTCSCGDKK
jgi:hypothetical protein